MNDSDRKQARDELLRFFEQKSDVLVVVGKCKKKSFWEQCYASLKLKDTHFCKLHKSLLKEGSTAHNIELMEDQIKIVSPLSIVMDKDLKEVNITAFGPKGWYEKRYTEYKTVTTLEPSQPMLDVHETFRKKVGYAKRVVLDICHTTKHYLEDKPNQKPEFLLWMITKLQPYLSVCSADVLRNKNMFDKYFTERALCSIFTGGMTVEYMVKTLRQDNMECNQDDVEMILEESLEQAYGTTDVNNELIFVGKDIEAQKSGTTTGSKKHQAQCRKRQRKQSSKRKGSSDSVSKKPRVFNTKSHSPEILNQNRAEDIIEDEMLD